MTSQLGGGVRGSRQVRQQLLDVADSVSDRSTTSSEEEQQEVEGDEAEKDGETGLAPAAASDCVRAMTRLRK